MNPLAPDGSRAGRVSLAALGVHLLIALACFGVGASYLLAGDTVGTALYALMGGLIAVSGVAAARIAARR